MSPATDGFSAMMSFLPMRRERPQRIPAKTSGEKPLAGHARARRGEKILGDEPAGRHLLIPQHHEHHKLELLEAERVAGSRERALDHELAGFGVENAGLLQRHQEAATGGIELRQLAWRIGAEAGARIGQRLAERPFRRTHDAGEPMQRLADIGILEPRRRQLACYAVAVVGELGLLAVLEQVHEDVVHSVSLLINERWGIPFTVAPPFAGAGIARTAGRRRARRAPGAAVRKPPARPTSRRASKASRRRPDRGPCARAIPSPPRRARPSSSTRTRSPGTRRVRRARPRPTRRASRPP